MRPHGSSGAGMEAGTWLSQPGTCQSKFHSRLAAEPEPGPDLDHSEGLKSNDNICLAGAYLTGHAPWQGWRCRLRGHGRGRGKQRYIICLCLVFTFVAGVCLLTFEWILFMQIADFALFSVPDMHADH